TMDIISNIIFVVVFAGGIGFFVWNAREIIFNIKLGRPLKRTDNKKERWKSMLLIALGQKKMFKRPLPAIFHLCIYAAFIITQVELIEIIADGIMGTHRVFRPELGGFYTFVISL